MTPEGRRRRLLHTLLLSALLSLLNLAYLSALPPVDADAYEYTALARSYARSGELLAHHVQEHFTGVPLPNPAWNRASLWTFLLVPFQQLFGYSYLAFAVPHAVAYFFIGPLTYVLGTRLLPPVAAFAASVAVMTNHRIVFWATREDPGLPDTLTLVLFLVALLGLLERRWVAAGVASGLALLTRLTGPVLAPLALAWVWLSDRAELRRPGIWIYLAITLTLGSAFFVRNAVVSGDPLFQVSYDHAGPFRNSPAKAAEFLDSFNVFQAIFTPPAEGPSEAPADSGSAFGYRVLIILKMIRVALFGLDSQISWYPGLVEIVSPLLLPFVLYGLWCGRRGRVPRLLGMFLVAYLAGIVSMKYGWEDRYVFPIIPAAAIFAFLGVDRLGRRWPWLTVRALLFVYLALEALPHFAFGALQMNDARQRERYTELTTLCEWGRERIEPDSALMTIPFRSPEYLCDRDTVAPVYGNLEQWRQIVDRYGVDYFLFTDYWGGDRPPRLPFLTPILRGRYLTLYRIHATDEVRAGTRARPEMADFNYLQYFWEGHFGFHGDPTTIYSLQQILGSTALAAIAYVGLAAFLLWTTRGPRWALPLVLVGMLLFGVVLRMRVLAPSAEQVMLTPPSISLLQLQRVWSSYGSEAGGPDRALVVVDGGEALLREVGGTGIPARQAGAAGRWSDAAAVLLPIVEPEVFLDSRSAVEESLRLCERENREFARAESRLAASGYEPFAISGGVVGIRRPLAVLPAGTPAASGSRANTPQPDQAYSRRASASK